MGMVRSVVGEEDKGIDTLSHKWDQRRFRARALW